MALIDNIISYYKLDEASGAIVDSVGNNNMTNFGADYGASGKINDAMGFVLANSDWIISDGNADLTANGGKFTLSAWVNLDNQTANHWIFCTQTATEFGMLTSGTNLVAIANGPHVVASGMNTGTWYLITMTGDGTRIKLYRNTTLIINDLENTTFPSGNETIIGSPFGLNEAFWDGRIDEVGLWNRALSSAEITELYNSGAGLSYPFSVAPDFSKVKVNVGDVFKDATDMFINVGDVNKQVTHIWQNIGDVFKVVF